ncbi:sulfite oxidase heme-binding subunit YedZ [Azonexus sp.]|uniref:sulfite oxidase heme-binding subunit YedZ n=1 Tax=Azonexus sp. TaxID=1872668 RepID=UPI0027B9262D|nr:protein-methionine-sulfoxide reductase heme-binding subunit MsrQ [Azonexus sp.]
MTDKNTALKLLKPFLFLICLLPIGWLAHTLSGQPQDEKLVEAVQRWTGIWTLNFLLVTLCISPLRAITGQHWLIRLRRMLGLFTFAYGVLHFLCFIGLDHAFSVDAIARDVIKHPYTSIGFAAFVLLIPLAATSNQWALRRLGGRKWQELHRTIYLIAILGCVHYLWLSQAAERSLIWPLTYSAGLAILLWWRHQDRQRKAIPVAQYPIAKPLKFFSKRPD